MFNDSLEAALASAFYHDPRVAYVMQDEAARRDVLLSFFRSVVIPAARVCGEVCTTPQINRGSLWIRPGRFSAFVRIVQTRMNAGQLKLGPSSLRRWNIMSTHLERIHRRSAEGPHWFLLGLGIHHEMSGVLVDPVLSRADRDHHPCYVESFAEERLAFYEDRGFRIAGAGRLPGRGPSFWVLIRGPR